MLNRVIALPVISHAHEPPLSITQAKAHDCPGFEIIPVHRPAVVPALVAGTHCRCHRGAGHQWCSWILNQVQDDGQGYDDDFYSSKALANIRSSQRASVSSKASKASESISSTPINAPSAPRTGTTISELLRVSQAM